MIKKEYPETQIITNSTDLADFCAHAAGCEFVTVDTEFLRERTYWPKLCLIQIATRERVVIVDPLASEDFDLSSFFELMRNEAVVKILHSPKQDMEIFWHLDRCIPSPLFDTQIAAMALGLGDSISYANLVKQLLHIDLDKTQQYTDWSRRPLSDAQMIYAAGDVTYLTDVYLALKEQLESRQRLSWIDEELKSLTAESNFIPDPENAGKRIRHRLKKPQQLAAIAALAQWRETEAVRRDHPRPRVLKDDLLVDIVRTMPEKPADIAGIRGMRRMSETTQNAIIAVLETVKNTPAEHYPAPPKRPTHSVDTDLVGLLSLLLKIRCREAHIIPRLVASRSDLDKLATGQDAPALTGWRYEIFGRDAQELLAGKLTIGWDTEQDCVLASQV